ncbi:hypothetical protein KSP40_PGU018498 [Platanthera guangdongensis]|uniref:Uncharacterized protein n=1 Tax=Platanthera guangdongensis TaxID=2320717 RepID=A0ABR2MKV9_9ASPA
MHQVFLPPGEEIVDYNHAVPPGNQPVNKVAPNKPRPSGNHDPQRGLAEADGHPPPSPAVRSIDIRRVSGNGEAAEEGEGGGRVRRMVVWVEEKEGGGDDGTDEDEEEALLANEVGSGGSGEGGAGGGMLCGLGSVGWAMGRDLLVVGA